MMMMKAILMCLIFVMMMMGGESKNSVEVVRDYYGEQVKAGVPYHMYSVPGSGGYGVGCKGSCSPCPFDVLSAFNFRTPTSFHPVDVKDGVVRVSTDVNIKFNAPHVSTVWRMVYDRCVDHSVVTIGGVLGNPGPGTVNNWFKLVALSPNIPVYKLVFCPSVCDSCAPACGDLVYPGVDFNSSQRRLVVNATQYSAAAFSVIILPNATIPTNFNPAALINTTP